MVDFHTLRLGALTLCSPSFATFFAGMVTMNGTVERCVLDVLGIPDLLGWKFQNELAARYMQELVFVQYLFCCEPGKDMFLGASSRLSPPSRTWRPS